jgi:hypothetical protein
MRKILSEPAGRPAVAVALVCLPPAILIVS